uniref:WDYHV motif-containing protein 1 n=1 Tax=Sinocyclocheilus grahami TaxID=75366 RepID=A0A672LKX6_SINGR
MGRMNEESAPSEYIIITPSRNQCPAATGKCNITLDQGTCSLDEVYVVFKISNERKLIPIWKQKSSQGDQPVIWVRAFFNKEKLS